MQVYLGTVYRSSFSDIKLFIMRTVPEVLRVILVLRSERQEMLRSKLCGKKYMILYFPNINEICGTKRGRIILYNWLLHLLAIFTTFRSPKRKMI